MRFAVSCANRSAKINSSGGSRDGKEGRIYSVRNARETFIGAFLFFLPLPRFFSLPEKLKKPKAVLAFGAALLRKAMTGGPTRYHRRIYLEEVAVHFLLSFRGWRTFGLLSYHCRNVSRILDTTVDSTV